MKVQKIVTAYSARRAKEAAFNARNPEPEVLDRAALNPRIATLTTKKGKTVFYAFLNGYNNPETYGTVEELTAMILEQEAA